MKKHLYIALAAAALLSACKKNENETPKPSYFSIRMTDAPAAYQQVNVDIQGVELTGQGKSVQLNVNSGVYNLLHFTNGLDTLIATGSLQSAKLQQVRLILGSNNSVMADSVLYPLTIPSGSESGLKIQVHQTLQAGVAYSLLLDFDAHKSVVQSGNGQFHLKPVIRAVNQAISGSISGSVSQPNVATSVTAYNSTHTVSSAANAAGHFIIQGVPAGTYTVEAIPASPYSSVTVSPVTVNTGSVTSVGVLNI